MKWISVESTGEPRGFLLPGIICTYAFAFYLFRGAFELSVIEQFRVFSQEGVLFNSVLVVTVVCSSFIFGHIVDTLSSVLFDRLFVGKLHQHPFRRALQAKRKSIKSMKAEARRMRRDDKADVYNYKIIIMSIYCLLFLLPVLNWTSDVVTFDSLGGASLRLFVLTISILLVVIGIAAFANILWLAWYYVRYIEGRRINDNSKIRRVVYSFVEKKISTIGVIWLPVIGRRVVSAYDYFDITLRHFLRLEVPLDDRIKKLIDRQLVNRTGSGYGYYLGLDSNNDLYWIVRWIVSSENKSLPVDVADIRKRAAFARSQSMALMFASFFCSLSVVGEGEYSILISPSSVALLAIITLMTSFLYLLRFFQLHFLETKAVFMNFAILDSDSPGRSQAPSATPIY